MEMGKKNDKRSKRKMERYISFSNWGRTHPCIMGSTHTLYQNQRGSHSPDISIDILRIWWKGKADQGSSRLYDGPRSRYFSCIDDFKLTFFW
jgi:hypothetical protein